MPLKEGLPAHAGALLRIVCRPPMAQLMFYPNAIILLELTGRGQQRVSLSTTTSSWDLVAHYSKPCNASRRHHSIAICSLNQEDEDHDKNYGSQYQPPPPWKPPEEPLPFSFRKPLDQW